MNAARVGKTKVGTQGKKESEPDDVVRPGLKALFAEEEHVHASSVTTKLEGAVMGIVPEAAQAVMHKSMLEPAQK